MEKLNVVFDYRLSVIGQFLFKQIDNQQESSRRLLCVIFFCVILSEFSIAQNANEASSSQELIIMLKPKATLKNVLADFSQRSSLLEYKKTLSKTLNIHLVATNDAPSLYQKLLGNTSVRFVQNNETIQWRNSPNDPLYDVQWALDTIKAAQAWTYTTGGLTLNGDTIVCAIVDGSFYVPHEDLSDNIWHNHAEIPGNLIDDDQNGFVDDYTGWQMVYNTDKHDYGSITNHGTAILGIIGGKGDNGIGVSGINWDIKMMLLSAQTANEITKISNVVEGYSYIMEMRRKYNMTNGQEGAFVVSTNSSWGIDKAFAIDHPIWCALYDSLGSVGVLSVAATTNSKRNIDNAGDMPCTCSSDYLLGVSESSRNDEKAAGYGDKFIELFAPAESRSTRWSDFYGDFGGTSGASPHVAGAIALMYSYPNIAWSALVQQSPQKAALLVKSILLNSVDKKAAFEQSVSGGRLNLGRAMQQLAEHFTVPETGELLFVFPSPVTDIITVKAALTNSGEHPIKIYNVAGQPVAVWTIQNTAPTIGYWEFDVEHLARGMYILELETESKKYTRKFVKY
jgi:subtilisin family serine protease